MQRVLVLSTSLWLVLAAGLACSNLTAPPGDDPRNLPQVAGKDDGNRRAPAAMSVRPLGPTAPPAAPMMRPPPAGAH